MSTEFLITALVVCLMPGAGVLYTLAVALGRGRAGGTGKAQGVGVGLSLHERDGQSGGETIARASGVDGRHRRRRGSREFRAVAKERRPRGAERLRHQPVPRGQAIAVPRGLRLVHDDQVRMPQHGIVDLLGRGERDAGEAVEAADRQRHRIPGCDVLA